MAGINVPAVDASLPTSDVPECPADPASLTDPASPPNHVSIDNATATDQKKDRKQRRERLPFPDPFPTAPVKRYPEPSKADLQAAVDKEDAKLQSSFDKLNSARTFFDQRQKIRDAGKVELEDARKVYIDLSEKCRILFDDRKEITNQLKALKEADIAARSSHSSSAAIIPGAGKDCNDLMKGIRTVKDLEDLLKELEYALHTDSYSLVEEKKVVSQINFLNSKGRSYIEGRDESFKNEKAAKDVRVASRAELEGDRKKLDVIIDEAKEKMEAQRTILDAIRAKQDDEIKLLASSSVAVDRDEEKKKIGQVKAVIKKLRDNFNHELDLWYLNERIHFEQVKRARKKKFEEQAAERLARRLAWEKEQAQYPEPHPYQKERDMCSGLIAYLNSLLGVVDNAPSMKSLLEKGENAPNLKSVSTTREISTSGTAMGKRVNTTDSEFGNLAFSGFVKKTGKSKNKKGRKAVSVTDVAEVPNTNMTLKPHSIDYLTAFTTIEVKPPTKLGEVKACLEILKEKAEFYETAPAPSEEEKAKKAEGKEKKASNSEKKSDGESGGMNGGHGAAAFPGLHSEKDAPSQVRDASLPSFKAVASGSASVPAVAPGGVNDEHLENGDSLCEHGGIISAEGEVSMTGV